MPENIKNDWLIASASKPQFTLGDFEQVGLTPDNTQLLSAKDYEKNDKIQKLFTNPETGKFDQDQFKNYYDVATQTYNDFAKKNYDSTLLNDNYFFEENIHAPKDAKRYQNTINIAKVKNPFNQVQGVEGFKTKTDSGLSVREIAQTQKVIDSDTGKTLDYTPNEAGFFGSLFKPTAVMAQWDADGQHYDADAGRNVRHQKGEFKYNEDGKNYYETLGNREVYGKEALSSWDVLTEDGSTANKWDFMDGDSLTKTLTGTIFKTVAQVIPHLLPGVGEWYTAVTVGNQLMTDLLPVLGKSTGALFLGDALQHTDFYKSMNQLQGFGKRFATSISDEGKQTTFNKENLFSMAGDVFGQLAQQKFVAKIPLWLGQTAKEAEVLETYGAKYGEEGLNNISKTLKSFAKDEDGMYKRANYLRSTLGQDDKILDVIEKWDKLSSAGAKGLGVAYMSAISASSVTEDAKAHGLDEKDTALMFLGTMAGFGAMMTKFEFAHMALHGIGLDELGGVLKKGLKAEMAQVKPAVSKIADALTDDVLAAAPKLGDAVASDIVQGGVEATKDTLHTKMVSMFNKGKAMATKVGAMFDDVDTLKYKIMSEALEETTEEMMQDGMKSAYNGLRALGFTSTDKEKSKSFEFDDIASRYAMSALGGAIGGGISGFQDKIAGRQYADLPESLTKDFASIARHGYTEPMQRLLDKYHEDGKFGSTTLSISQHPVENPLSNDTIYKPMSASGPDSISHNDFIYNTLSAQLRLANNAILEEGIDTDLRLNEIYEQRAGMFVDIKNNTAIVDDIDSITAQIVAEKAKIVAEENGVKEGTKSEANTISSDANSGKKKIADLKEQLMEIVNGDRAQQYLGEALFGINQKLYGAWGIHNKESLAFRDYQKPYTNLNPEQKTDIDGKIQDYNKYEKRTQVRLAKGDFDEMMNGDFNTMLPAFDTYGQQRLQFLHDFHDLPTTLAKLNLVNADSVSEIDNTKLSSMNLGQPVIDTATPQLVQLANYVKAEKYLNPAMLDFVKNNYDAPLGLTDHFYQVYSKLIEAHGLDTAQVSLDSIAAETGVPIDKLLKETSYFNFKENIESLKDIVNNKDFNTVADFAYNDDDVALDPKELKKAYLSALSAVEQAMYNDVSVGPQGETILTPNVERTANIESLDYIRQEYKKRSNSPLMDYIEQVTKREGRTDLSNLLQVINSEFNNLASKNVANDFIIDNKVSLEQLEYGRTLLEKIDSLVHAATDYSGYVEEGAGIGYNAAMNAIAVKNGTEDYKPVSTISSEASVAINQDLVWLLAKIDFLLDLHKYNQNGSIRELKATGATMSTLFLQSLDPNSKSYKVLRDLGIDMSTIDDALDAAEQYRKNLEAIQSEDNAKVALDSSDDAYHRMRKQKDKVEQAIFAAVNTRDDRVDIINKILDEFKGPDYVLDNNPENFASSTKRISEAQKLMYLAATLTVDPKQFYKDFVGDIPAGENLIAQDPYAPFYGQEHVIKQMYWHTMSKLSPVDTFRKVADVLQFPDHTLTDDEKDEYGKYIQLYHFNKLKNATVLFGMPGAGKTTSALFYLSKIAERYNMDVAIFAPHTEQGNNLKESLKDRPNVYNDNKTVTGLLQAVAGNDLLDAIRSDYAAQKFTDYDINDDIVKAGKESTLLKKTFYGNSTIVMNPNHPLVAKFLADETKVLNYEGKIPRMIVIDEATHIPSVELQLLNHAIEIHNKTKEPIALFLVGDREQRGNNITTPLNILADNLTTNTLLTVTPVLSQSLRNRFNIKNKNINVVRALRDAFEKSVSVQGNLVAGNKLLEEGLKFEYEDNDVHGLVGEKLVREFSKQDLQLLYQNPNDKIALITESENPSLVALIKEIPGAWERTETFTPDNVQGLERDSIIIDLPTTGSRPSGLNEANKAYASIELLYTMISRSKKGSLIKAPFIASINLTSTNEDVHAQKIELDPDQISKYKDFTVKGITESMENLDDLDLSPKEGRRETVPVQNVPTKTNTGNSETKGDDDVIYEVLDNQVTKEDEDPTTLITTTSGGEDIKQASDEIKPMTYTFHERLGAQLDADSKVTGNVQTNQDMAAIYRLLHDEDLPQGIHIDDAKVVKARRTIKDIKTGVIAYASVLSSGKNPGSLQDFLRLNYKVDSKVLTNLIFKDMKVKLETREFNEAYDRSYEGRAELSRFKGSGLISYMVLDIPHAVKQGETPKSTFITVTAFPNINNPNVAVLKGVMSTISDIKTYHINNNVNGVSNYYYDPKITFDQILKPTSNLYIRKETPYPYKQFKDNHTNLNVSDTYIVMNTDIISQDEALVEARFNNFHATKSGKGYNKDSNALLGRPVIFVSYDKSIPKSQLPDLYRAQLNRQMKERADGQPITPGTIRMIPLNKKGLNVSDWLKTNIAITKVQAETDIDLKAQRRAYGNNFAAASMLGSLVNFKRRAEYYKANPEAGRNLRESLELPQGIFKNSNELDSFINQIDTILKTALPMITGQTFNQKYAGVGVTAADGLANFVNQSSKAINDFLATDIGKQGSKEQAIEHFIAQDLLKSIHKYGAKSNDIKEFKDSEGNISVKKLPNSSLYDMVSSLRLALTGGIFTTSDGTKTSVDGIMQDAFTGNSVGFDQLLKGMDAVIKRRFPDGIHVNAVLRTSKNQQGYAANTNPFVVPTGNIDDAFLVDIKVQTPTIYFDPSKIDLTKAEPKIAPKPDTTELDKISKANDLVTATIKDIAKNSGGKITETPFQAALDLFSDTNIKGDTKAADVTVQAMTLVSDIVNRRIENMVDDVATTNGVDFKITGFDKGKLTTTGLKDLGLTYAVDELTKLGANLDNITVDYNSRNAPGTTDKQREFVVSDALNGEIIGTFAYKNKQFTPFNFQGKIEVDFSSLSKVFTGSPVEGNFKTFEAAINDNSLFPVDPKGRMGFGKEYLKIAQYLKSQGLNTELDILKKAYDNLIQDTNNC